MNKLYRNIAIISTVALIVVTTLMVTNYIQFRSTDTINNPILEELKTLLDQDQNNTEVAEQIRNLDLLSRRAYFSNAQFLKRGASLMIFMVFCLLFSLRMLFRKVKNLPEKEIDVVDEWIVKTVQRKQVIALFSCFLVIALGLSIASKPFYEIEEVPVQEEVAISEEQTSEIEPTNEVIKAEIAQPVAETVSEEAPQEVEATPEVAKIETTTEKHTEPDEAPQHLAETVSETPAAQSPIETKQVEATSQSSQINHHFFRGDNTNGHTSAKNLPDHWDLQSGENILWKTPTTLQGYSSPIIHGEQLYITGASASSRELYCYQLSDGTLQWTAKADQIDGSPAKAPDVTEDTGYAASTPATNGTQVAAIFATGDIICTDTNGKRLWAKNLGTPDNHYGHSSSLVIHKNSLLVQYDTNKGKHLIALNIKTGDELWRKARPVKISWASPTLINIDGTDQLILSSDPLVIAYNPNNGEELWRTECMSAEVGPSVCYGGGLVFAVNEYAKLAAINPKDGSIVWEDDMYMPEAASPVATEKHLYICTSYGDMVQYDLKSGDILSENAYDEAFYASPTIAEGKLYAIDVAGHVIVRTADETFTELQSFDTQEATFATPAFTDGKIILRSNKHLYCVAKK